MRDLFKKAGLKPGRQEAALLVLAILAICIFVAVFGGYERLTKFIDLPELADIDGLVLVLFMSWPVIVWYAWRSASNARAAFNASHARSPPSTRADETAQTLPTLSAKVDSPAIAIDRYGVVTHFNSSASQLFGYEAHEAIGQDISTLICPDSLGEEVKQSLKQALDEKQVCRSSTICRTKKGASVDVRVSAFPICDSSGETAGAWIFPEDSTTALAESLRKDEDRINTIIEHAEVGITIATTTGQYLTVNPNFCRFLGRDESEIIGRSYLEFAHPDDIKEMESGRSQILQKQKSTPTFERRYIRKDGQVVWGSMTPAPVHDQDGNVAYFVTVIVDVTDLRRTDSMLRESEERLHQIVEATGAAVWEVDVETGSVQCNERFKELSGYGDAFPGTMQAWDQLIHPDDRADYFNTLLPDGTIPSEIEHTYRIRPVTGAERWVRVHGHLKYGANGRPVRGAGLMWDITDDMAALNQRQDLEARLADVKRLEMLGKLTGGIAHNFNNLLTIMMGSLQLLPLTKGDPVEIEKGIDRALAAGKRAAGLTKKLLAFSSNQSLSPAIEDIRKTLADMEPTLTSAVGPKVDLVLDTTSYAIDCEIDHQQLKQAITHIVANSQESLPNGGTIMLRLTDVAFSDVSSRPPHGLAHGRYAQLVITDNGEGMTDKTLERAFEPFYTTKDFSAGSGLGLSMVYGFIQQSGGAITLDSRVGEGTTVTLYVPAVSEDSKQEKPIPTDDVSMKPKILLVEDDIEVRARVREYLLAKGFAVEEALTAVSALKILETDGAFDILFSDIVLPGSMNGIDLAYRVREILPDLRIVLATGYIDANAMGKLSIPEFATLIAKPYDFEMLVELFMNID